MNVIKGYDYDDLLLVPVDSSINSRDDVDLSFDYKNLHLRLPIIASPMIGIVGTELIIELDKMGGLGILHRFHDTLDNWKEDISKISTCSNWGFSIGLNYFSEYDIYWGLTNYPTIVCIDVANGYTQSVLNRVTEIKSLINSMDKSIRPLLLVGNVVTVRGALNLVKAGADLIRVGIGSGGLCSTRNMTGIGYPQLSTVDDCSKQKENVWGDYKIVSDGGIRNASDIVKVLACGADLVMIGSLFASCQESDNSGIIYGMASRKLQEEYFQTTKSIEGIERKVEKIQTLQELISNLEWNMRSAYTYMNARNTKELQLNAQFITTGKGTLKDI